MSQKPKPQPPAEIIAAPSTAAVEPNFFEAMMAFQYGEGEESDAGFDQMKKLA